jgi:hypothetical protein
MMSPGMSRPPAQTTFSRNKASHWLRPLRTDAVQEYGPDEPPPEGLRAQSREMPSGSRTLCSECLNKIPIQESTKYVGQSNTIQKIRSTQKAVQKDSHLGPKPYRLTSLLPGTEGMAPGTSTSLTSKGDVVDWLVRFAFARKGLTKLRTTSPVIPLRQVSAVGTEKVTRLFVNAETGARSYSSYLMCLCRMQAAMSGQANGFSSTNGHVPQEVRQVGLIFKPMDSGFKTIIYWFCITDCGTINHIVQLSLVFAWVDLLDHCLQLIQLIGIRTTISHLRC